MNKFIELGLSHEIIMAITEMGFEKPTPIQEKVIPAIIEHEQDIIGLAQTGTGKTAGFGLPLIQKMTTMKAVQMIVLCPTRELCMQITKDLKAFTLFKKDISVVSVYGGANILKQISELRKGASIVVGTPGRTLDLIKRKVLKIDKIKWVVLDEADEMLKMGFREDLDQILDATPPNKQTYLFSATMPEGVRNIAKNYMKNPMEISIGKKNTGADNVAHHFYVIKSANRYLALKRIADINHDVYGIIFCRTRQETKDVADKLIEDGYNADALHGDLSQSQRDSVMDRFRKKHLQLLVATDVAARGIDVNDLTHIINYNLPEDHEAYIHRSGRTGRAGKSGISITLLNPRETHKIKEYEKIIGKKFNYQLVPNGKEICEKRLDKLIENIEKTESVGSQIDAYMPAIIDKLHFLDKEEIIRRFVSAEFNTILDYYKNAGDLNSTVEKTTYPRTRNDKKPGKRMPESFSRIHVNAGSKHKLTPALLIGMINDKTQRRDVEIGKIEILRNFSFFEIEKSFEKKVTGQISNGSCGNIPISAQVANEKKNAEPKKKQGGITDKKNRKRKNRKYADW